MSWKEIPDWAWGVAQALLLAIKERDPVTYGHSHRVAHLSGLLARAAGLSEAETHVIQFASLFHDLGKLGIPDEILLKPGRLNSREEAIMRSHPIKSVEIIYPLHTVPFFQKTLAGVRHHHERVDGRGYPDGIPGERIPLTARVMLVADTFDAMTTQRPYRKPLPADIAYKELRKFAGRQFDADIVKVFLQAHPTWRIEEADIIETFAPAAERKRRAA